MGSHCKSNTANVTVSKQLFLSADVVSTNLDSKYSKIKNKYNKSKSRIISRYRRVKSGIEEVIEQLRGGKRTEVTHSDGLVAHFGSNIEQRVSDIMNGVGEHSQASDRTWREHSSELETSDQYQARRLDMG